MGTSSACIAWRQENLGRVSTAILLSESYVITGGAGGAGLRASDRVTGERVWTTNESLTAVFNVGSPIAADGTVYFTGEVTGEGGHVFAVDAETGREQWRLKPIDSADTMGTLRYDSGTLYGTSWVGDSDDETVAWAVDTAERTTR